MKVKSQSEVAQSCLTLSETSQIERSPCPAITPFHYAPFKQTSKKNCPSLLFLVPLFYLLYFYIGSCYIKPGLPYQVVSSQSSSCLTYEQTLAQVIHSSSMMFFPHQGSMMPHFLSFVSHSPPLLFKSPLLTSLHLPDLSILEGPDLNSPAMPETWVWFLGWEDSPGEGNSYPFQYSGLENFMDRGAWQATIHGVAKSQTQLSDFHYTVYHKLS